MRPFGLQFPYFGVCDRTRFLPKIIFPGFCLFSGLGVFEGDPLLPELRCSGLGYGGLGGPDGLTPPWGAVAGAS